MNLRERKRALTRDRLFEAAVTLFVERGYDETTMDEIAERATVSRATAFNYFPRKEDLLSEWAQRRRDAIATRAERAGPDRGEPAHIQQTLMELARSYTAGDAGRTFVRAWLRTGGPLKPGAWASVEVLGELVRDGQATGSVRPDVDPEVVGRLLLNGFLGLLYQWGAEGRSGAWLRRELSAAVSVILDGVAVGRGPGRAPGGRR